MQTEVCRKGREKELYLISSSKDKGGADKFTDPNPFWVRALCAFFGTELNPATVYEKLVA